MASRNGKKRFHRRERRKAKASGWKRPGKAKSGRVAHGGGVGPDRMTGPGGDGGSASVEFPGFAPECQAAMRKALEEAGLLP